MGRKKSLAIAVPVFEPEKPIIGLDVFRRQVGEQLYTSSESRVGLRPFKSEDAPVYASWLQDQELCWLVGEQEHSREEVIRKQTELAKNPYYLELMIVEKDSARLMGDISLKIDEKDHNRPKYGIMIGDLQHRTNGYGKEALCLLLNYVGSHLPINQIYAEVFDFNLNSLKFHEKMGFQNLGPIMDESNKPCYLFRKPIK